jgi:hypothetical protein
LRATQEIHKHFSSASALRRFMAEEKLVDVTPAREAIERLALKQLKVRLDRPEVWLCARNRACLGAISAATGQVVGYHVLLKVRAGSVRGHASVTACPPADIGLAMRRAS